MAGAIWFVKVKPGAVLFGNDGAIRIKNIIFDALVFCATLAGPAFAGEITDTFRPEPPEGWTREVAEAGAIHADGEHPVTISLIADRPMVAAVAGMQVDAGVMGMRLVRVGRIRVCAEGDDPEAVDALLEAIDDRAPADFGR